MIALFLCLGVTASAQTQSATQANGAARVTRIIKDVRVFRGSGASGAAVVSAALPGGTSVHTGFASRAELTFPGAILTRLGANTVLRIGEGARDLNLSEGAVLFQASSSASGASIQTGAITTSFAGSTGIVDRQGKSYLKVLVMQGTARVFVASKVGESILVKAGQILITKPEAKALPEAVDYDIAQLYKTSLLTNRDFAPLSSRMLIEQEIAKQKNDPALIGTNLVIYGRGTLVTLADPGKLKNPSAKKNAPPTPTPAPSGH